MARTKMTFNMSNLTESTEEKGFIWCDSKRILYHYLMELRKTVSISQ